MCIYYKRRCVGWFCRVSCLVVRKRGNCSNKVCVYFFCDEANRKKSKHILLGLAGIVFINIIDEIPKRWSDFDTRDGYDFEVEQNVGFNDGQVIVFQRTYSTPLYDANCFRHDICSGIGCTSPLVLASLWVACACSWATPRTCPASSRKSQTVM